MKAATAIEISRNSKIGLVSATYASQNSCPSSCPFKNAGCYAETGMVGIHTHRLNRSVITDPEEIAKCEAEEIRKLTGRFPLRLHVVGDCNTDAAAQIVAEAASEHTKKHGQVVWTYTHAHDVDRKSWKDVSVLRSCENVEQVETALEDGYAAAMVVSEFERDTAYPIADGIMGIPCPQQTGKAQDCVNCKLCMNADKLHSARRVILFAAHGTGKKKVIATVTA
jgi:hypothetical protein